MNALDDIPANGHPEECPRCKSKTFSAYNMNPKGDIIDCDECPNQHEWDKNKCKICNMHIDRVKTRGNICKGKMN